MNERTTDPELPPVSEEKASTGESASAEEVPSAPAPSAQALPVSFFIEVPFTSQAPYAVWDAVHEDACEEASLLMVASFRQKKASFSKSEAEDGILALMQYEKDNNYPTSINIKQMAEIAKGHFGLNDARIEPNPTADDIKKEVAAGKPVIIPAAGKILPNPNFKNGGPIYHLLVVVGYENGEFITNDPGTRKGEGFRYKYEDLINSIHDWNEADIMQGQRVYLVFD